jgi:Flp pilus assembly pilin Flp
MSLSLATVLAGWSRPQEIGRVRGIPSLRSPRYGSPGRSLSMKRFVNPFVADGSSASVIESGLIIVLVGLACMTAWMHVSASLKIPSASANTTASVETTGSVRSRWLHRASRTRRLRRSEKRLYATRIELRLSQRECACPPCVGSRSRSPCGRSITSPATIARSRIEDECHTKERPPSWAAQVSGGNPRRGQ